MNCDYCHGPLPKKAKPNQRFCCARCRSAWHKENDSHTGTIYGIYQRPAGGWSVVTHYPAGDPPSVVRGQTVVIKGHDNGIS